MNKLQRLEKLEAAQTKGDGIKVLLQNDDELPDDCIKRHCFNPMARGAVYVLANKLDVLI